MSHPLMKGDPKSPSMSRAINYSATDPNNHAHGSVNPSQLLRCILSLFRRTRLNRVTRCIVNSALLPHSMAWWQSKRDDDRMQYPSGSFNCYPRLSRSLSSHLFSPCYSASAAATMQIRFSARVLWMLNNQLCNSVQVSLPGCERIKDYANNKSKAARQENAKLCTFPRAKPQEEIVAV